MHARLTGGQRAGRRPLTRVLRVQAAILLGLTACVVQDQAAPHSAHASCLGVGSPVTDYWLTTSANIYARESSRESCNGNRQYLGKVFDTLTDGSCAYAQYHDGSYTGVQGRSCDSAGYSYTFNDQTGNTSAGYRVYVSYFTPSYLSTAGY
jgi:hypothetical protein